MDCPHHWVTPSLGKGGEIGFSRHNFAATPLFPDLSTPMESMIFLGSNDALGFRIGVVFGRKSWKNLM